MSLTVAVSALCIILFNRNPKSDGTCKAIKRMNYDQPVATSSNRRMTSTVDFTSSIKTLVINIVSLTNSSSSAFKEAVNYNNN